MKSFVVLATIASCVCGSYRTAAEEATKTEPPPKEHSRLRFVAYDGDPKMDPAEKMSFQVDTLDIRQPAEFLKIGDIIRKTRSDWRNSSIRKRVIQKLARQRTYLS